MDKVTKSTIEYYDNNAVSFKNDTISADMSHMYNLFRKYVKEGHILDLGCGVGRDTKYFLDHGYDVTPIDGSKELCKIAEEYTGITVRNILFDELDYIDTFDGVWACASLLHVSSIELPKILKKIERSMKNGAYLYASFKSSDFEGNRGDKFYLDMTEEKLKSILLDFSNLEVVELTYTKDVRSDNETVWLNMILKKI